MRGKKTAGVTLRDCSRNFPGSTESTMSHACLCYSTVPPKPSKPYTHGPPSIPCSLLPAPSIPKRMLCHQGAPRLRHQQRVQAKAVARSTRNVNRVDCQFPPALNHDRSIPVPHVATGVFVPPSLLRLWPCFHRYTCLQWLASGANYART